MYKWVQARKCLGVTLHLGLALHPGGVAILLVPLCHENRVMLQSILRFTFYHNYCLGRSLEILQETAIEVPESRNKGMAHSLFYP